MTSQQLRQALRELNGERHLQVVFADIGTGMTSGTPSYLEVKSAMLIPDEDDHLVKVTDGKAVYIIDADRIVYIRIGLK